jgi:hypothetical protein
MSTNRIPTDLPLPPVSPNPPGAAIGDRRELPG